MNSYTLYSELIQPSWAPPAEVFGPVWTVLYIIIAISFGRVFFKYFKKELSKEAALPFALNIIFNVIFTPIQFGLQNQLLATIDILLVVGTLIWALSAVWKCNMRWVAVVNIPYLLWGLFATALQLTITYLNW